LRVLRKPFARLSTFRRRFIAIVPRLTRVMNSGG
jgi:hypothetical protein